MTTWMIWLLEQETRHLLHHDPPPTHTHTPAEQLCCTVAPNSLRHKGGNGKRQL